MSLSMSGRMKILALSSGGGHWVQLLRLRPAFEGHDVTYVTTRSGYRSDIDQGRFRTIPDCNRDQRLRVIWCAVRIVLLLVRVRPDIVISTGAAPGYLAVRVGRWLGARTIWVDSVANADELSMAGRMVGPYSDLWLTQWPHLASEPGPKFLGSVL
jgi:UDP-N-acetylglucosamine:LPS N-acetylglucosamine transferase